MQVNTKNNYDLILLQHLKWFVFKVTFQGFPESSWEDEVGMIRGLASVIVDGFSW